jgi:hypothetical protein
MDAQWRIQLLGELRATILRSADVPDGVKLDAVGDIDTIQGQLEKRHPDSTVVNAVWKGIERAANLAGAAERAARIASVLGPLAA